MPEVIVSFGLTHQNLDCCFYMYSYVHQSNAYGENISTVNLVSYQPDIQDHQQQNIEGVDAHSPVQAALQILTHHREPNAVHQ